VEPQVSTPAHRPPRIAQSLGTFLSRFIAPLALVAGGCDLAAAQGFTVSTDLVFATVETAQGPLPLRLDLYQPLGATEPLPLVIFIHGGGWSGGTKNNPGGKFLLDHGFALASIEYRLSGQAIWPAQIHDVKGAVRWLRAHAAALGLDPDRFGAFGTSAGGHLAAFAATAGDAATVRLGDLLIDLEGDTGGNHAVSSRVQAASDFFGPGDFLWMGSFPSNIDHEDALSPESKLLGGELASLPLLVTSADPMTHLDRGDPPLHIQHGTADPAVPYSQSARLFREASLGTGLDTTFLPIPDGGHGGPGFDNAAVTAFFLSHLGSTTLALPSVTVSALLPSVPEGSSAQPAFRISRSGATTHPLRIAIALLGTAREGIDFAPLGLLVDLPAGSAHVDVALDPLPDNFIESDEDVVLAVCSSPAYRAPPGGERARLLIADDDVLPSPQHVTVAAIVPSVAENAPPPGRFRLTRTGNPTQLQSPLAVRLAPRGRAAEGGDYLSLPDVVLFGPGVSSLDLLVIPIDDAALETIETVMLEVTPGGGYVAVAPAAAVVTILDDEDAAATVEVCIAAEARSIAEGAGATRAFQLSRTGAITAPLTVFVQFSGEASPGSDYAPLPATFTFAAGEEWRRIDVDPLADPLIEGDESLIATVLAGSGYRPGLTAGARIELRDDDAPAALAAELALEVAPLAAGGTFIASLRGDPNAPFALFVAAQAGHSGGQTLGGMPFLLDAGTALALANGNTDPTGAATIVFPLPTQLPEIDPNVVLFQAVAASPMGGFAASNRVVRALRPRLP
jgi:acetyl esterase/lipase